MRFFSGLVIGAVLGASATWYLTTTGKWRQLSPLLRGVRARY